MTKRGRPRKKHDDKMRVITISISPLQFQIIDKLCETNDVSRSELMRGLIESAGTLELGIVGGVNDHIMPVQMFRLPKTGGRVCNPHSPKGFCKNSRCEALYKKEGLL